MIKDFFLSPFSENTVGYILITAIIAACTAAITAWLKNRGQVDVARINAMSAEKINDRKTEIELLKIMREELAELRKTKDDSSRREELLLLDVERLLNHLSRIVLSTTEEDRQKAIARAEAYLIQTGRHPDLK